MGKGLFSTAIRRQMQTFTLQPTARSRGYKQFASSLSVPTAPLMAQNSACTRSIHKYNRPNDLTPQALKQG
jgi:hypothetical protein